jgi:hypothetical protein
MPLDEGKKLYVEEVNIRRKARYDKHLEEYQRYLDTPRNKDQIHNPASPDHSPRHSRLMTLKKNTIMTTPPSQSIPFQSSPPKNNLPQISLSQSSLSQSIPPQISLSRSSLPQSIPPQISLFQNTPVLSPTPHSNSGVHCRSKPCNHETVLGRSRDNSSNDDRRHASEEYKGSRQRRDG